MRGEKREVSNSGYKDLRVSLMALRDAELLTVPGVPVGVHILSILRNQNLAMRDLVVF